MQRRAVLTGLMASIASASVAEAPLASARPVQRPGSVALRSSVASVQALVARSGLSGRVAYAVADAQSGTIIDSALPVLALPPASVAKSLTALYALDQLGPDHRFFTRVLATGGISGGRLDGDLILVGGGDPTLNTDGLARLAVTVRNLGISEVAGRLLVWGRALPELEEIDSSQPVHVGYNPAISGLNLNFNRVYFEWKPQGGTWQVTMDARSERVRPAVDVVRMSVAGRDLPVYTHRNRNGREEWTVASNALGNGGGRWLPVRNPALYAGDVFAVLLAAQGVRVPRPVVSARTPQGQLIAEETSDKLPDILRGMLRFSTNLTAEVLGLAASQAHGARPRSLRNSAQRMNDWVTQATGAHRPRLVDHSGLDGGSRLTATDMVRALGHARTRERLPALLKQITPSDAAVRAGAPANMNIRAKTGTLNFVSTLAGYFDVPGQGQRSFAIFCADLPRREGLSRAERERPPGGRGWQRTARGLQMEMLAHWARGHG